MVHTVFVCQIRGEGAFPSRAANHLLTVKQFLDDGCALCITSLSVLVAVLPKIDQAYTTKQCVLKDIQTLLYILCEDTAANVIPNCEPLS